MDTAMLSRGVKTSQSDAVMSRRSFVKSATAAAVLGTASPQALMAETKEGMPQRALGRTGEKVSAIGLGGYHIGKQADEAESIMIIRSANRPGTHLCGQLIGIKWQRARQT